MTEKFETVLLGRYPYENEEDLRPIEWLVLEERDGCRLLLSKYNLQCWSYHVRQSVTWEKSDLRGLLNEVFYPEAFSEEEQDKILKAAVDGVCDRVFLLSVEEARWYFCDDEERVTIPTPYACRRGARQGWWLRDRGMNGGYAADVLENGEICSEGEEVYEPGGVRPALWVRI